MKDSKRISSVTVRRLLAIEHFTVVSTPAFQAETLPKSKFSKTLADRDAQRGSAYFAPTYHLWAKIGFPENIMGN